MFSTYYLYPSLDPEGRRSTTDDLTTSCLHLSLSFILIAFCESPKSSSVHSLSL